MGWLDEQIRLRKQNDDQVFAESLKRAAGTVLGKPYETAHDDRLLASSALEKILRFYHLKPRKSRKRSDRWKSRWNICCIRGVSCTVR